MDTRTGDIYPSQEAALEAGVPLESTQKVRIVTKGPFKGRIYEETAAGGLGRRRQDLEIKRARAEELAAKNKQIAHLLE